MSVQIPDFIQIPKPILQNENLQPGDKFLFGFIYWFTSLKLEKCTASNETLGKMTGLKTRSTINALKRLKDEGFIRLEYSGPKEARKTVRVIHCLVSYRKKQSSNNDSSYRRKQSSNNDRAVIKNAPKEEYINNNKKDFVTKKSGKPVDNDHRGKPSPAKERMREIIKSRGIRQLTTINGG